VALQEFQGLAVQDAAAEDRRCIVVATMCHGRVLGDFAAAVFGDSVNDSECCNSCVSAAHPLLLQREETYAGRLHCPTTDSDGAVEWEEWVVQSV
jgi:hypothetical protein